MANLSLRENPPPVGLREAPILVMDRGFAQANPSHFLKSTIVTHGFRLT
jgi:hypothetical protein